MPELETRYPCPVCLGVTMDKTRVGEPDGVMLDHCARCGGAWFELGEVQLLRRAKPADLWARIAPRADVHRAQCHSCHTPMERTASTCPTCGQANVLDCPVCEQPMKVATHEGLRLDSCSTCKGIWFDHHELSAIWRMELSAAVDRHRGRTGAGVADSDGGLVLLEALAWNPGLVFYGAHAAGHLAGASVNALANAPEAAGAAVEAAGEAAVGVFELIMEIISGFFD
ncbi:MAG: zf-TFIIB domain-containing protein [Gemmatimonadetes bacterium]|nr:zf-TFIIB domain-containing protein [Gemmatimonadota bacterium]